MIKRTTIKIIVLTISTISSSPILSFFISIQIITTPIKMNISATAKNFNAI